MIFFNFSNSVSLANSQGKREEGIGASKYGFSCFHVLDFHFGVLFLGEETNS